MADHSPPRVVSLQPSATVTLADLDLLQHLVGCTKWCADVVTNLRVGLPFLSDSWTADAAEIVAAKPDLVIASVPYQAEAVAEILKSGARFLGLAPRTLADVCGDIAAIAGIMQVPDRGAEIITRMQHKIEAVRLKTSGLPRRRVYCEEWGKPLIYSQPWVAELIEAAGGAPVGTPGAPTDAVTVAALQPEVVIAAWCGAGDRVPLERIVRERGWDKAGVPAVRNARVYCISDELLNTPASTLVGGLHALAAAIHPEHFPAPARGLRRIQPAAEPVVK
jgi:iron complex transport system substrate-binding protein